MDTAVSVELFVEILNRYVYYFDQQNETVISPLLPKACSMLTWLGDNKIPKRPHRTHPFQPANEPGQHVVGEPEAAFPADAGLYPIEGV